MKKVEADVQAGNTSSLALFEHHGFTDAAFQRTRQVEQRLSGRGPLVVMQRALTRPD